MKKVTDLKLLISSCERNISLALHTAASFIGLLEKHGFYLDIYICCPIKDSNVALHLVNVSLLDSQKVISIIYMSDLGLTTGLLKVVQYMQHDTLIVAMDDCIPVGLNKRVFVNTLHSSIYGSYDYIRLNRRGLCLESAHHSPTWMPYYISFTTAIFSSRFLVWLLEREMTLWELERKHIDIPRRFKILPAFFSFLFFPPLEEVHCLRGQKVITLDYNLSKICQSLGYKLAPIPVRIYDYCYNCIIPLVLSMTSLIIKASKLILSGCFRT
jgi:hypothetical protein